MSTQPKDMKTAAFLRTLGKKLRYCLLILIGQSNAFGSTAFRADDVKPLTLLNPSLTMKANFYFGDEDEMTSPISETGFFLLDESLISILKDSKFKPEFLGEKHYKAKENDYLTAAFTVLCPNL